MPTIDKTQDRQVETGVRSISPSTLYAQPWWRGFGNDNLPSRENTRDPITHETIQSQDSGGGVTKETGTDVPPQSGLNGSNNQEQQHLKHVASSTPPVIREHMEANSQMELVGHSIMLTQSYPYLDPQYAGMMTYGAPVPPHFYGIPQNRMLLPLQTEEEPVYVNAKQYNQILRRRERRAKAEAEKKVIQSRKPYLHESRHQHAMRRARGSGGRFLNTKKLKGNGTNSSEGKAKSGRAASTQSGNSSGSEHLSTSCDGNSDHQVDRSSVVQDLHEVQAFSNGHELSSSYYAHSTRTEQGRVHINQENWSLLREQAPDQSPQGAVPPK